MDSRILLDTNSYLRLASVFHPLVLSTISGPDGGTLWILAELYRELERNSRLRGQFSWALLPEFAENRKRGRWRLSPETRAEIESTYDFALKLSQNLENGASPFDIRCLAYGVVLEMRVVTDDRDMVALGKELEVEMLSTLGLLELFLSNGYCDLEKIRSTVRYWMAVDDLPGRCSAEYRQRFGEEFPTAAH